MAATPDLLFGLRNSFYLGAYQAAINSSDIPNLPADDALERDVIVQRSYIALGSYQLVINEIDSSAPTALQAVKLLALYLSGSKEAAISSIQEWLSDAAIGNNPVLRLIAGIIYMHEQDYNEALKHTNAGGTMELYALNVQIFIKMHRSDYAEKQLKIMQQIDEDHTLTQLANAWLDLAVGGSKIQEAYLIFQDFSEKYQMTGMVLNGKAVCCIHMGRFDEAESLLLEALNKDAKDAETLANLVVCSLHLGKSSTRFLKKFWAFSPLLLGWAGYKKISKSTQIQTDPRSSLENLRSGYPLPIASKPSPMAVSLQSAYYRPVALDHRHSLSLTIKNFAGPKSDTFRRGLSNVNVEFHSRVNQSIYLRYSAKKGSQGRVFMMPIGIPRVPYRTPGEGTWQWVDLWNALYRERVIFIGEHIDEEYSNQVLATMLYLDSIESSKKIYLYINGPGGDLTPSMSIYDTMQSLQSPVATHCVGYAYDMAAYILAAGEKGNRSGMPLCEITLQTPAGVARGQADDVQNEANELLRIRDYLFSELAKKTGQPLERISKDLVYVARFTAQEALEYGLIDRIIRPSRIKPDAPRKETPGIGRG